MPKSKTNPNGANQYVADPRQSLFIAYYLDPKSPTFSNALQSGLKAGFAQEYSENILQKMPVWLVEKVEKFKASGLLEKAERNMEELLDLPSKVQAMGAFGPIFAKTGKGKNQKKVPIMVHATGLLKIKNDMTQFVAERVGRSKYGDDKGQAATRVLIINISQQSGQRYGAKENSK